MMDRRTGKGLGAHRICGHRSLGVKGDRERTSVARGRIQRQKERETSKAQKQGQTRRKGPGWEKRGETRERGPRTGRRDGRDEIDATKGG